MCVCFCAFVRLWDLLNSLKYICNCPFLNHPAALALENSFCVILIVYIWCVTWHFAHSAEPVSFIRTQTHTHTQDRNTQGHKNDQTWSRALILPSRWIIPDNRNLVFLLKMERPLNAPTDGGKSQKNHFLLCGAGTILQTFSLLQLLNSEADVFQRNAQIMYGLSDGRFVQSLLTTMLV